MQQQQQFLTTNSHHKPFHDSNRITNCVTLAISIPRDKQPIFLNGAIQIICTILKLLAASARSPEQPGGERRRSGGTTPSVWCP